MKKTLLVPTIVEQQGLTNKKKTLKRSLHFLKRTREDKRVSEKKNYTEDQSGELLQKNFLISISCEETNYRFT